MMVGHSNPPIRERQNAVRGRILNGHGQRRLFVNQTKAPYCYKGLSTVQVKDGSTFQEADSEYQHVTTAIGYYIHANYPISGGKTTIKTSIG